MPVILDEEQAEAWMFRQQQADELRSLLVPAPEKWLVATPVSARANSVKNDDPDVLVEAGSLIPKEESV